MISAVLLEQVTPLAMEAALAVQQASVTRAQATDKLCSRPGQRAASEADLARRHLMAVAPAHRLVARTREDVRHEQRAQLEQAKAAWHNGVPQTHTCSMSKNKRRFGASPQTFQALVAPGDLLQAKKRLVRLLIEDGT